MKKYYGTPSLVEYGPMDQLTLGATSTVPDIDQNGNAVGVGCETQVFSGFTRTSCSVVSST
jgi:hypothetical protein